MQFAKMASLSLIFLYLIIISAQIRSPRNLTNKTSHTAGSEILLCSKAVPLLLESRRTTRRSNERASIPLQCATCACDPVTCATPTPVVACVPVWPTANTATSADLALGTWCHRSAADPARAHWAPLDSNAIIRVSVPAGSVTTVSGARGVPEATTVTRGVVLAAATSPARCNVGTVSASATTRDSVLARWGRKRKKTREIERK